MDRSTALCLSPSLEHVSDGDLRGRWHPGLGPGSAVRGWYAGGRGKRAAIAVRVDGLQNDPNRERPAAF